MNKFLKTLENKKIYIVSPHFDDAVLSCGQLIQTLTGKAEITVVNIFTKAQNDTYTFSGKKYLALCGENDAAELHKKRQLEDKKTLKSLGCNIINLDFQEALFRKKRISTSVGKFIPEFNHLYPTFRYHVMRNNISENDDTLNLLEKKLTDLIPSDAILFVPEAKSHHVDHFIARVAGENVVDDVFYYSEFPYNVHTTNIQQDSHYQKYELSVDADKKNELINNYKTQLHALFPDGIIPNHKEIFFKKKKEQIETKYFTMLSQRLENDWKNLWEKSEYADVTNSPEWFLSAKKNFPHSDNRIIAIYKQEELVAIGGLVKEKIYGKEVYTIAPNEFVCGRPLLLDMNNTELKKHFSQALSKLGTVFFNNVSEEFVQAFSATKANYAALPCNINYFKLIEKDEKGQVLLKNKNNLLRGAKHNKEAFTLQSFTGNDAKALDTVFTIDRTSRKQNRGYNAFSDEHIKGFYRSLAQNYKDKLLIHLLYFENKPIVGELGFLIKKDYIGSQLAFLSEYSRYSPGRILLVKLFEKLGEKGVKKLDFGSGDSALKRMFTSDYKPLYQMIFSDDPSKFYLTTLLRLHQSGYTLFNKLHIYSTYRHLKNKIKK